MKILIGINPKHAFFFGNIKAKWNLYNVSSEAPYQIIENLLKALRKLSKYSEMKDRKKPFKEYIMQIANLTLTKDTI